MDRPIVQGRHGSPKFFLLVVSYIYEPIETQNLGKAQALGALPAVAPLNTRREG